MKVKKSTIYRGDKTILKAIRKYFLNKKIPHVNTKQYKYYIGKVKKVGVLSESPKHMDSCINTCAKCAQACEECFTACLEEPDVEARAKCIKILNDCAEICLQAVQYMARNSDFSKEFCDLCAKICDACAKECEMFKDKHCQECAQICRECAEECRKMAMAAV